ncbi:MAG: TetR/AcrR family transcriptional regulator [Corynebacteriales bacterium]|nr:TetR/AcrR family transcriptional regulator [Mycobacteriales bacterium]
MGHKEDLLEGAKRCLLEKGLVRTTARDIVAASGANLASIGYHYGSKAALTRLALMKLIEEWGDEIEAALTRAVPPDADPFQRFEVAWATVIEQFEQHRQLWVVNLEMVLELDHDPELREAIVAVQPIAQREIGKMFQRLADSEDETVRIVGGFHQALLMGVVAQRIISPETAPTAADLAAAMRFLVDGE